MTEGILKRLAEARKRAGLSQSQVDRLMSAPQGMTRELENHELDIYLRQFLLMCELYDISPEWALTGVNPNVDTKALRQMLFRAGVARNELSALVELLVSVPAKQEAHSND